MQLVDFQYNGETLSEYGLMVCSFDGGDETIDIGSKISMNKVKAPHSHRYMYTSLSYEDTLPAVIQVCKFSCGSDDYVLTEPELRAIMRWLNRKGYYKFKPIYDELVYTDVYYNATFNVQLIKIGGDVVGLELTLDTDSPYGYSEPIRYDFTFNSWKDKLIIQDYSDDAGYVYCDVTIKCLEDGDLTITNSLDQKNKTVIYNCKTDEVITLRGQYKLIESSEYHPTLYNDFNYNFIRICNAGSYVENVFTSSLKCEVSITYSPIRKVGLIV